MIRILFAVFVLLIPACQTAQLVPVPASSPAPVASASPVPVSSSSGSCETVATLEILVNWGGKMQLPATGAFVVESHLASSSDRFEDGRLFPEDSEENINAHLALHDPVLRKFGRTAANTYTAHYERDWTPPENGKAGQGSVGDLRPSIEDETFIFNMYWRNSSKPKPGTKYLMSYQGKHVVVVAGYEVGPGGAQWIGGAQPAVHKVLGADDESQITVAKLKDQSLKPGPINCP